MRRGRTFAEGDAWPGREGAIVDERFAETYFPGGDALGRRIQLRSEGPTPATSPWLTIVGVAPTMPDFSPPPQRRAVVHVPIGAEPSPGQDLSVVARSAADLAVVAAAIREEVRAIDPDLPIYAIETVDAAAARARLPQRLVSTWFGVIALIGLVLSTLGVYALTAYGVAQRTQEIGVRMALGARAPQVVWLFLRRTGRPSGCWARARHRRGAGDRQAPAILPRRDESARSADVGGGGRLPCGGCRDREPDPVTPGGASRSGHRVAR